MWLTALENSPFSKHLSRFLPLTMSSALAAMHIVLVARSGDESLFPFSLLFWLSIGMLIWQKRRSLVWKSDLISALVGIALLAWFIGWGLQAPTENYLAAGPFIGILSLTVFMSGFRCLRQYRSELTLMFLFGVPKVLLWPIVDLRETTARFSTLMLKCLGFDVLREGTIITLPNSSVEVIQDCSGLNGMLYLLAMSGLLLVMLPLKGMKQYFAPLIGVAIAFVFNGARVSFLAIMAADPNPERFQAWHSTSIFSLGALGFFCGLYCLVLWLEERTKKQNC